MAYTRINAIQHGGDQDRLAIVAEYLYSVKQALDGTAKTNDYFTIELVGAGVSIALNDTVAERMAHMILKAINDRRLELLAAREAAEVAANLTVVA